MNRLTAIISLLLLTSCSNPPIDCVKIGMTTSEVEKSCGTPTSKEFGADSISTYERWYYWQFMRIKLYVSFDDNKVRYYSYK